MMRHAEPDEYLSPPRAGFRLSCFLLHVVFLLPLLVAVGLFRGRPPSPSPVVVRVPAPRKALPTEKPVVRERPRPKPDPKPRLRPERKDEQLVEAKPAQDDAKPVLSEKDGPKATGQEVTASQAVRRWLTAEVPAPRDVGKMPRLQLTQDERQLQRLLFVTGFRLVFRRLGKGFYYVYESDDPGHGPIKASGKCPYAGWVLDALNPLDFRRPEAPSLGGDEANDLFWAAVDKPALAVFAKVWHLSNSNEGLSLVQGRLLPTPDGAGVLHIDELIFGDGHRERYGGPQ